MNTMTLVVILGAPNDGNGELSSISIERVHKAFSIWKKGKERGEMVTLIATGGFGEHFNKTNSPHFEYVTGELESAGVASSQIIKAGLLSSNTVEDAILLRDFLEHWQAAAVKLITSSYHMERCRLIFDSVFVNRKIQYCAASDPSDLSIDLVDHESQAIKLLKNQGGVLYQGRLYPLK